MMVWLNFRKIEYRNIYPRKYATHPIRNGLLPALMAAISIVVIMYVIKYFNFDFLYGNGSSEIIFASFASSAFILFMMPRSRSAQPSKFLKSYFIAAGMCYLGFVLIPFVPEYLLFTLILFFGILLLIATRSEHAPAMAILFAFLLFKVGPLGVIVIIVSAFLLLFLRIVMENSVFILEGLERKEKGKNKSKKIR